MELDFEHRAAQWLWPVGLNSERHYVAKMYRPALTLTNTSLVLFTALVLLMLLVLTLRTLYTVHRLTFTSST